LLETEELKPSFGTDNRTEHYNTMSGLTAIVEKAVRRTEICIATTNTDEHYAAQPIEKSFFQIANMSMFEPEIEKTHIIQENKPPIECRLLKIAFENHTCASCHTFIGTIEAEPKDTDTNPTTGQSKEVDTDENDGEEYEKEEEETTIYRQPRMVT
jgi:hypothetical protein